MLYTLQIFLYYLEIKHMAHGAVSSGMRGSQRGHEFLGWDAF